MITAWKQRAIISNYPLAGVGRSAIFIIGCWFIHCRLNKDNIEGIWLHLVQDNLKDIVFFTTAVTTSYKISFHFLSQDNLMEVSWLLRNDRLNGK